MSDWIKGNRPSYTGLYWVTVDEGGSIKMYDEPMMYEGNDKWMLGGNRYYTSNIIAYMTCNKPKEAYNDAHIGFPEQYYIKITCNGITRYLSKGLQSVKWSKEGYATKDKAITAARRLKKIEPEYGYQNQKTEITVVNGNGENVGG